MRVFLCQLGYCGVLLIFLRIPLTLVAVVRRIVAPSLSIIKCCCWLSVVAAYFWLLRIGRARSVCSADLLFSCTDSAKQRLGSVQAVPRIVVFLFARIPVPAIARLPGHYDLVRDEAARVFCDSVGKC